MKEGKDVVYEGNGNEVTIKFSGYINHFTEIDIEKVKNFETVNVDFEEVTLINSLGIQKWFAVLSALGPDVSIKYFNIPPSIVTQMSLVVGFIPKNAKVMTFYAPYFDKATKDSTRVLLKPEDIIDGKAPVMNNDQGQPLLLDAIEEIYFSFLGRKSE